MGAGVSQEVIKRKTRAILQRVARDNGGTYAEFAATGKTDDGLRWRAAVNVSRASNGEAFGFPVVTVEPDSAPEPVRLYARTYSADKAVPAALLAYRLDAAQAAQEADPAAALSFDWEGKPGEYGLLFDRKPFFQTWGADYCLALDGDGFQLFNPRGEVLAFKGEGADFWARDLFVVVRPEERPKDGGIDRALDAARGRRLDAWAGQFEDEAWTATADWRAKPDHYLAPVEA